MYGFTLYIINLHRMISIQWT